MVRTPYEYDRQDRPEKLPRDVLFRHPGVDRSKCYGCDGWVGTVRTKEGIWGAEMWTCGCVEGETFGELVSWGESSSRFFSWGLHR